MWHLQCDQVTSPRNGIDQSGCLLVRLDRRGKPGCRELTAMDGFWLQNGRMTGSTPASGGFGRDGCWVSDMTGLLPVAAVSSAWHGLHRQERVAH